MKSEWVQTDFNDCIDKVTYTKKVYRSDFLPIGKYPIISQEAEFINGYWDRNDDVYKTEVPVVIFGDHTQVLKYIDFDFVLGADGVKILKAKPFLYPKYLYYYMQSMQIKNLGYARHFRLLKEKKVTYPLSLSEQKRIVSKLDDIFKDAEKAKEIAEKNLQNAKDLFESYLENVFSNPGEGWNIEKLGNVCELVNRGISPKYINENGLHVINQRCIRNHYIDYSLARMHNEKVKKVSVDKYLRVGDVLINSTGVGTLGRVAQVKDLPFPATVDSHVTIVRPFSDKFNHQFFEFVLIYLEKSFEKSGMGASGQIELSRDTIKNNFTVSYPQSISTQTEIADKLRFLEDRVRTMVTIYKEKVSVVDELRKSVLNKAFSGEL